MHTLRSLGAGLAVIFVVVGCKSEAGPAPATAVTVPVGDAGQALLATATAAAAANDAGPDFYACATDSDCVAVPRVGCCFNGHMEAVNKAETDAYKASFTCEQKRTVCPQYRVLDRRTPQCIVGGGDAGPDAGSPAHCQMMRPEDITCGDAHKCPTGFNCQASKCVNAGGAPPATSP